SFFFLSRAFYNYSFSIMAQRDLTFNTPQLGVDGHSNNPYDQPTSHQDLHSQQTNPFASPGEESSSFESRRNSFNLSDDENSHYGRPFNAYNNNYASRNGTSSNLLSQESSVDDFRNQNTRRLSGTPNSPHADSLVVPPEFDRYPSMGGSRNSTYSSYNNSSSNLVGAAAGAGMAGGSAFNSSNNLLRSDDEDSLSNKSDPFVQSTDFSPFGGYPALSFPLHIDEKEPDDYLHNPDPIADAAYDKNRFMHDLKNMDKRSFGGLMGIIVLLLGAIFIFIVFPVLTYSGVTSGYKPETYAKLSPYSYPLAAAIRTSLVDPDTPKDALTKKSLRGEEWVLAFSDEFNVEGRTFYEGDDQFFTAPDIHYQATNDLEWYDPDAVTTANGTLVLTMDALKNHDLFYRSGMVQSWNQLCFSQGMIMISAQLPNYGNVSGLWPGLWTMGNLGRPGYLGSTEGVWPYTYDSCDAGITANQSSPDGEDHPNPGQGRGAPEIDILEGEVDTNKLFGVASQSYQIAPYDIWYYPDYNFVSIHNPDITTMNTYTGGPLQQAVSGTTTLNTDWYERGEGEHTINPKDLISTIPDKSTKDNPHLAFSSTA
ncbi:hypothetical protein QCA50_016221, partial [Cerrena zonata]